MVIPYNPRPGMFESEYPKPGWSGGWSNQISWKSISTGLNIMYYINEQSTVKVASPSPPSYISQKTNSFILQHIFLAHKIEISQKECEIFASARNLFQNKKSTLQSGYSAYYGLGLKAKL
ncbi:MAG: hypothetical protein ABI687_10805 [Flavitalea sp.]